MRSFFKLFTLFTSIVIISTACTQNSQKSLPAYVNLTASPAIATAAATPAASKLISPSPAPSPSPTPLPLLITAGGDVMFDSFVAEKVDREGINSYIEDLSSIFKNSDISVINLETAISNRGEKAEDKQYTFRADPKYLKLLTESGINLVSLANNHSLDYGITALEDSFNYLKDCNISYAGAGKNLNEASAPVYINKKNTKTAFIASSRVIPFVSWNAGEDKTGLATTYDPSRIIAEIKKAKAQADLIICYIHWGEEGKNQPLDYQRNLAHTYIDNGADIVIGTHPHVLQGMEYYKNKIIAYSLGNLVFTDYKKSTAVLQFKVSSNNSIGVKIIPFEIDKFKPVIVKDSEKSLSFYNNIEDLSFNVKIDNSGNVSPKF